MRGLLEEKEREIIQCLCQKCLTLHSKLAFSTTAAAADARSHLLTQKCESNADYDDFKLIRASHQFHGAALILANMLSLSGDKFQLCKDQQILTAHIFTIISSIFLSILYLFCLCVKNY